MKAAQGQDRQDAFHSARSHSSRVRFAKFALPLVAALALVGLGGYMWMSRVAPDASVDLSGSAIKDGKLIMANPKLDGFTSGDRPYSVRAARAIQDLTGSGAIDLERIQANVPMDEVNFARILAPEGTYDSDNNTLIVRGEFTVETTGGMRAELDSAAIDLKAGTLKTDKPVQITLPGARIEAERMEIEDNGKRLVFENRVRLVVQPRSIQRAASETAPPESPGEQ